VPTPTHFFINFTKKDSLIGSLYSKYQSPPLETLGESLFRGSSVKHIDLSTKEEDITDSLSTILRLLGEELEEASWLIQARSRMDPVEPYNEE